MGGTHTGNENLGVPTVPVTPRRILVTGGAGFIGRHLGHRLTAAGHTVTALDLLNPQMHREPERSVAGFPGEVVRGDVRDAAAVGAAVRAADAVVHLAAETGVGQSMYETERYETVNVAGTGVVLDAAARVDAPVVVLSSRAVYGQGAWECPAHGRCTGTRCCADAVPSDSRESDLLAPVSVYGETKVGAERLAGGAAARGLPVVVLRPQNVIGAGQALHNPYTGVLAAFAARLAAGRPPLVYGDGSQTRDFIAVDDVAAVVAALLDDPAAWASHPVLNVGSGVRTTLRELAETACRAAGRTPDLEFVPVTRPGDVDDACADLTRYRAAGLPEAAVSFPDAVAAFLAGARDEEPVDPGIWDRALDELSTPGSAT